MANSCSTEIIAKAVREYAGVTRKSAIGRIIKGLRIDAPFVVASFGEDAAVIQNNDEGLLLAADGIWSKLMEADPYWAGYCSVLVNIHDIAAMGGRPLAMVDVLSVASEQICHDVSRGMLDASRQFGVPIVGGHLHPDTPYNVIDVAILGIVRMDAAIYSHTAREGDRVVAAIDLDGRVHPSCILNWDSVTMKSAEVVRKQIGVLEGLGRDRLVTAGKDISNPGVIGTLGMLLEMSGKGAVLDLDLIPCPDLKAIGITFDHWVRMYPGMGFILTVRPEHVAEVCRRFANAGMAAADIGSVDTSRRLTVTHRDESSPVFDLSREGIMRIFNGEGVQRSHVSGNRCDL
ncbi:MAG: methanogenesis marker 2 protein [Methanomicrobiales archaeon]|nr:methanogenesis marker 2 protein [Methanomicrobiales archaeon]